MPRRVVPVLARIPAVPLEGRGHHAIIVRPPRRWREGRPWRLEGGEVVTSLAAGGRGRAHLHPCCAAGGRGRRTAGGRGGAGGWRNERSLRRSREGSSGDSWKGGKRGRVRRVRETLGIGAYIQGKGKDILMAILGSVWAVTL